VILGRFGRARSPIHELEGINYFHVRLENGQQWQYEPPAGHTIAWLAVDQGRLYVPDPPSAGQLGVLVHPGQLAVFEETGILE